MGREGRKQKETKRVVQGRNHVCKERSGERKGQKVKMKKKHSLAFGAIAISRCTIVYRKSDI
jgi:hypothetical protein